jgi:nucleoside-diphosphate-sugar epimerase
MQTYPKDTSVLVTGATGFIGRRLLRTGDRALVRRPTGLADEVVGDLLAAESLLRACEGVETVFHCAGHAGALGPSSDATQWLINFEGTRNLLHAAGQAGVRKFVFLSSVKAMADPGEVCADEDWPGEPPTAYGRAKRAAEDAVLDAGERYGMHVVILRLVMVYGRGGRGNLERLARALRAGWFPRLPETGNRRSIVHVQDVVEVMRIVVDRPEAKGRTYIVSDPRPYSGRELCDAILAVPPEKKRTWSVPPWILREAGRMGDAIARIVRRPLPIGSEVVNRLLHSAWYSPARIQRDLGWRARIGLMEGVREMFGEIRR